MKPLPDIDFAIESTEWLIGFRGQEFVDELAAIVAGRGVEAALEAALEPGMSRELKEITAAAIAYAAMETESNSPELKATE